jgi:hypothetical protein
MACRVMTLIFILVAIVLGILAVTTSRDAFTTVVMVSRFFEVMIPVLGVAALLKYITTCSKGSGCKDKNCNCKCCGGNNSCSK